MTDELTAIQPVKLFCLKCRQRTKHIPVREFNRTEGNEEFTLWLEWAILECAGCESITFMEKSTFSEDINMETGQLDSFIRYYPERSEHALPAKPFTNVPQKLRRLYGEVIESFNREVFTLCAGGLRAIVEGICLDQGVKRGPVGDPKTGKVSQKKNLEGRINGLVGKGLLTKAHATVLHKHRFLGNDALHELDLPSRDTLIAAIEIIEHTLENIYELPIAGTRIKRKT
jgi:hypothetical protein